MSKKLVPKAKNKASTETLRKVTKIVKKVAAKLEARTSPKTSKKVIAKAGKKPTAAKPAAKKAAPQVVKKASKPAAPSKKPAMKTPPKPLMKPQMKPTPAAAKKPEPTPASAPSNAVPSARTKPAAPKAIASSAKSSPSVKVKRLNTVALDIEHVGSLTDEDIRAMPESAYMNEVQFEFFRQRLIKMREEVLARELDVKERLHQREVFADPADRATAEEEHWLDLRLRERESMLMRKIEEALRRIRDKEYGYCIKTGESIGIPRLLARPTATVIVDVKGQDEKVETHFRDR